MHNSFNEEDFDIIYEDWLDSKEGKEWESHNRAIHTVDSELLQKLGVLKQKSKKYTDEERKELLKEFEELKTYEDKLNFWQEKELSLLDLYYFDSVIGLKYVLLINPSNDNEKSLYFTKLAEWINIVNEEDKDKSYNTLIKDYHLLEKSEKVISEQITIAENSIENIKRKFWLQKDLIELFLSIYQYKDIVNWYGVSDHDILPLGFDVLAYKISKVIGFAKYKKFLNGELENLKARLEFEANSPIEKNNEENISILQLRTFKREGKCKNDVILKKVLDELIKRGFIKSIDFKDFVKAFDYQPIELGYKELKPKIIWKYEYKNSTEDKKSYDWTELLTLIEFIADLDNKDFRDNNTNIRDIIVCCFEFDDNTMGNKYKEILKRINRFANRGQNNKRTQIEKLINELKF